MYTLPRGTKYSRYRILSYRNPFYRILFSKARPPLPPLASADSSSTSRSWIPSTSGSDASVAALVNESKVVCPSKTTNTKRRLRYTTQIQKPNVKTGDLQRLPDGTIVEKIALDKERVR